jgi:hypothetical protein
MILITNIWWRDVDRDAPERGNRSRYVRKDHITLDVRRQVPLRHSIHLRVIDVYCGGRWKSQDVAFKASTRASRISIWTISIFSDYLIYNRRCLLRFGSLCRAAYPHRQACLGYSNRDVYPPATDWGIELILIGSVLRSRFSWWLPRDRGKYLWGPRRGWLPHYHGGPGWRAFAEQL